MWIDVDRFGSTARRLCVNTLLQFPTILFQVKIWFQNRRMKWRNSKERELLANGGSREQTLPNKNNPNPDLSDADCDRPKIDLSNVNIDYDEEEEDDLMRPKTKFTDNEAESSEVEDDGDDDEEINVTWP